MKFGLAGAAVVTAALALLLMGNRETGGLQDADVTAAPVLSVMRVRARDAMLPVRIPATGHVTPWQEASVGTEADGLRLTEVRVNVGDVVKRGQVLAVFDPAMVEADLAEARAAVALAEAERVDAEANEQRASELGGSGAMSAQQAGQLVAAAMSARARLASARAIETRHRLRLAHTRVLAPDAGVITARTATVGAVLPAGEELFRLIRDGRLEWRASVPMRELDRLAVGQRATILRAGARPVAGTLRMLAPAIDEDTHDGLAYVDLPDGSGLRAGAFARGHIEIGQGPALTLPQGAVLLRDGFSYVMRVGPDAKVMVRKVAVGRRVGDRVEITAGLRAGEDVIASGLAFLGEGDTVRVVAASEPDDPGAPATPHRDAAAAGAEAPRAKPGLPVRPMTRQGTEGTAARAERTP